MSMADTLLHKGDGVTMTIRNGSLAHAVTLWVSVIVPRVPTPAFTSPIPMMGWWPWRITQLNGKAMRGSERQV